MSNRRFFPMLLGFALVLALAGAGLMVAQQNAGGAQASAAASPSPSPAHKAAPPRASLAQISVARRSSGLRRKRVASKGDSDPIADKAGEIAARYERGPQYQIKVGASPLGVRARHAINLYIPPHDPMYNVAAHSVNPPTGSEPQFIRWMVAHTPQKNVAFLREKWRLARTAIRQGHLTHQRVLAAFLMTPREWFVRGYNLRNAYENTSLPIGYGQTITDPETVIAMTNALDPRPNQRVLEIGTGSGYQSAFLSELSNYVYTIEIVRPLGEETNQIYLLHTPAMPQYANIHRQLADGYYGWPKYAPFDRIIVTTGIDHIPPDLLKELKPGGKMVIPVGPPTGQTILMVTKSVGPGGQIQLKRRDIYRGYAKTIFVPFTSSSGGTHNGG